ncbi:hypothetical protein B0H65DRAFT_91968 [Neurospora tetraspora]|uniref:Uncharacterized protein n=1 Tax=Neurospora tetraspora TaxID=94610 RepID=A0AAE0MUC8_9PEZI|nr:hypothetical protein B0H65DRAFT_91968 [Neurospora tetraspora]
MVWHLVVTNSSLCFFNDTFHFHPGINMKSCLPLLTLLSASLLLLPQGVSGAEALAPKDNYPKPPSLQYLYTVNITGGETYNIGNGPNGLRLVVPILNGTFSGPKLKGWLLLPIQLSSSP